MGTISDKLTYLGETKARVKSGLIDLGYPVTSATTFREMANMLYEASLKKNLNVDLTDLPQYWHDAMLNAIAYTMALDNGYVHLIVTTDNHYNANYGKSAAIQKILYGTELYSKVINIGDISNGMNASVAEVILDDYEQFGDDLILALGNHDDSNANPSLMYPLIENNSAVQGSDVSHFNYYVDDSTNGIRYMVMNTPRGQDTETYLKQAFEAMPSGYEGIIISHYAIFPFTFVLDGVTKNSANTGSRGGTISLMSLGMPNNRIICALCGHQHIDNLSDYLNMGLIKQITLLNDGYTSDPTGYEKVENTVGENAVSIVSVNKSLKDVKVYRIGKTSLLPERYSFKYGAPYTMDFHADILHAVNGGISERASGYTCLKLLPLYDSNTNLIHYYVINKSQESVTNIYESHYTSGVFTQRWPYGLYNVNNYTFTKYPITWIDHGNGIKDGSNQFLIGITMSGTVSASDLILATPDDDYDLGYACDEIEWVDKVWRKQGNNISLNDGYIGSKYISVSPGQSYTLSVDDANWSATHLSILGTDKSGAFVSQILLKNNQSISGDITFTIPSGVCYLQICSNNLANYTDKVSLTLNVS